MHTQHPKGCVIAAPHSGSGKTLVTLGLLRALMKAGYNVASAKVGPDYIDAGFHARALSKPCINLDIWAMGEGGINALAARQHGNDLLIVEGVMGLFDGADDGNGSTADVAVALGLPIVLVVDARAQSWSAAALLLGFKTYRNDVVIAGVIFNRVGSTRHESLLRKAADKVGVKVLGVLPRDDELSMPSRHLGLVQAAEQFQLEDMIEYASTVMMDTLDLSMIVDGCHTLSQPSSGAFDKQECFLPPLGQRIAVARDEAFSFTYTHMLDHWHEAGAEITPFSPLADQKPDVSADAVFLPGGYPELHAGVIAANEIFLSGLKELASDTLVYGECGGFMVMGETLIDEEGTGHKMAGLLPVTTSFASRSRHLGYRKLSHESALPWPKFLRGHEFHYSTLVTQGVGSTLFQAQNALDEELPAMGMCMERVMGSYAHIIAPDPENVS